MVPTKQPGADKKSPSARSAGEGDLGGEGARQMQKEWFCGEGLPAIGEE